MTRVQEIRQRASTLTNKEKAKLAADLLESIPAVLDDDDGGVTEARRRDAELEDNTVEAITWDQLRRGLRR